MRKSHAKSVVTRPVIRMAPHTLERKPRPVFGFGAGRSWRPSRLAPAAFRRSRRSSGFPHGPLAAWTLLLAGVATAPPEVAAVQGGDGGADEDAPEQAVAPWLYGLEFGLNGAAGNASFLTLISGFEITRPKENRYQFETRATARYGRNDSETIENLQQLTSSLKWRRWGRLAPVATLAATRDVRRRLDLKARFVTGLGVRVWKGANPGLSHLDVELGAASEYENFAEPDEPSEDFESERRRFRLDTRLAAKKPFGLIDTAVKGRWRPSMGENPDHNVEAEGQVSTELLSNWSLVLRYSLIWDERPPPGAEPYDHKFGLLLRVALGQG